MTGWFGDRAVLVPLADAHDRQHIVAALAAALPHCTVRPGLGVVLVEAPAPDPRLLDVVRAVRIDDDVAGAAARERTVVIDVRYDGSDLSECAAMLGTSPSGLAQAHAEQVWRVAMMGFAPGFAYLVPAAGQVVDWGHVQRRAAPRTQVPAGSVAVAAGMSAVYPHALPGGWQLIGTTSMVMFDVADAVEPTALHPGDQVRFRAIR